MWKKCTINFFKNTFTIFRTLLSLQPIQQDKMIVRIIEIMLSEISNKKLDILTSLFSFMLFCVYVRLFYM